MNPSTLASLAFEAHIQEARRHAARPGRDGRVGRDDRARRHAKLEGPEQVLIRSAVALDAHTIDRLAALDSGKAPQGPALVAEVGGEVVAAIGVDGGRALADPFRPTADVVRLLELRAAQLRDGQERRGPGASRVLGFALLRRAA